MRERVYAAIPGWGVETGRHLRAEASRIRNAPRMVEADVRAEIAERAEKGESIPIELGFALVEVYRTGQAHIHLADMLDSLSSDYGTDRDDLVRAHEAAAVAAMRSELERIVEETRKLAPDLKGIRSADDVVGEPKVVQDAWLRLGALAGEYSELRATQLAILRVVVEADAAGALWRNVGQFADFLDVAPVWRQRRVAAARYSKDSRSGLQGLMEWFDAPRTDGGWSEAQEAQMRTGIWPDEDHRRHLLWVAKRGTAWVPNGKLVVALNVLAQSATSPVGMTPNEPTRQLQALAQVCELTGQPYPKGVPDPDAFVTMRRGSFEPFDAKGAAARTLETTYI